MFSQQNVLSTTKKDRKHLNRVTLDAQLNGFLRKASVEFKKHIRTHSLRLTFVKDLFSKEVPLHKVKEIVGHRDIKSTLTSQNSKVSQDEIRDSIINEKK